MNVTKIKAFFIGFFSSVATFFIAIICGKHLRNKRSGDEEVRDNIEELRRNTEDLGRTEEQLRKNNSELRDWIDEITKRKQN